MKTNRTKVGIIVPEYNEGQRAVVTINSILKFSKNIVIIVDDGSSEDSFKRLVKNFGKNKRVVLLRHIINLGKGAAMKTGVEWAKKNGYKKVLFIDADGQHNPKYIKDFVKCLDKYPIVFGYRILDEKMPFVRKWGNLLAAWLINFLFNIKKKDLLSGYLGFNLNIYKKIKWESSRYGIETEMATKVGKSKIDFKEIKVDTIYIDKYKGVTILDALKILVQIPFWYFQK